MINIYVIYGYFVRPALLNPPNWIESNWMTPMGTSGHPLIQLYLVWPKNDVYPIPLPYLFDAPQKRVPLNGPENWQTKPPPFARALQTWQGLARCQKPNESPACKKFFGRRKKGVSKNSGTPKSSILIGFSIINHPFWGTIIFGNTHMFLCWYMEFPKETQKLQKKLPDVFWGGMRKIIPQEGDCCV